MQTLLGQFSALDDFSITRILPSKTLSTYPRHVVMGRAAETPHEAGRPLSSAWELQGTEAAH